MHIAVIISSRLGLPLLQDLAAQGVVAGVAVPHTGHDEPEQLAQTVAALGLPVQRLHRPGLGAALAAWLAPLAPDAVLVLTLPWRIPAAVLALPRLGFLNVHFAALPGYRGPEPLFWQLRNGEAAGAVTIHRMEADFDTGPVLVAVPVPIGPRDTHGLHRGRLAHYAVAAGRQLLAALRADALPLRPQEAAAARYWPRATLADVCVRWAEPAAAIDRLVRATNPWNRGALATLRQQPLRLLGATPLAGTVAAPPGTVVQTGPDLLVACGAGELLRLDIVVLEEGYFTGAQLAGLGVLTGELLGEFAALPAAQAAPAAAP
ncbi:formyltransferase family protein [Hymenobacter sp. M29]|uniref:Formyltransferase family protein n=1 Tax=Hymenobacter mellowenesis TaxID=3063995 RepID=A0ABT9A9S7_9BACT|nr:formyltransferase family protein [Hymenobacter sp. M29]MDO7846167.1 formyltransferase family protein [Hymenobacter sp. M29]